MNGGASTPPADSAQDTATPIGMENDVPLGGMPDATLSERTEQENVLWMPFKGRFA